MQFRVLVDRPIHTDQEPALFEGPDMLLKVCRDIQLLGLPHQHFMLQRLDRVLSPGPVAVV
jgi:hypothetical protein